MVNPNSFALVLFLVASLASAPSCTDDADEGPTQDEMQQVAAAACEQLWACGLAPPDITLGECTAHQFGSYQDSPECLALFDYDECKMTITCEEIDRVQTLHVGPCLDELEAAAKVRCLP